MDTKKTIILFLVFLCAISIFSQEEKEKAKETTLDSTQINFKEEGIIIVDPIVAKKNKINPLAPSKAAFYSAILPGLGQIYNKDYWKVPLVYAAIGAGIYAYDFNNQQYNRVRTAFKRRQAGFTDDEFFDRPPFADPSNPVTTPEFSTAALQDAQERFQRDRDLMLLVTIGLYALNIIEANVDSHLNQFNIDDDLSLDFQPYIDFNEVTASPNYGMALIIKF